MRELATVTIHLYSGPYLSGDDSPNVVTIVRSIQYPTTAPHPMKILIGTKMAIGYKAKRAKGLS